MRTAPTSLTSRGRFAVVAAVLASLLVLGATATGATASTANRQYVQQLYGRYASHSPGTSEIDYWAGLLDGGTNRVVVVNSFFHSEEASALQAANLMHTVLNRTADAGAAYWGHHLASGMPRIELLAQLYASQEFYANQGASDENFVFGIYQSLLGRNPTQADRNYWIGQIQTHGRLFVSRVILGTNEGLAELIDAGYQLGLHHGADPDGSAYWSQQISTGALSYDQVIVLIIASDEAYEQAQS